ncbi:uncharacterized protein BCR38DRAFT_413600 [Pseudomassariella vexata]|uniref:Uncharacterized protein n=1 Tax=Pseudomassariella vexata TaxID=1141098 RepID=A0A1Y2DHH8_9PEZI|nr:uncharacterized protein BCR38DRAFT_413600 [Pseudomassariella vexata]ORY58205.1 hypothetical protein BCR38DRAFT_413600 [Pseudomassariella vexata]
MDSLIARGRLNQSFQIIVPNGLIWSNEGDYTVTTTNSTLYTEFIHKGFCGIDPTFTSTLENNCDAASDAALQTVIWVGITCAIIWALVGFATANEIVDRFHKPEAKMNWILDGLLGGFITLGVTLLCFLAGPFAGLVFRVPEDELDEAVFETLTRCRMVRICADIPEPTRRGVELRNLESGVHGDNVHVDGGASRRVSSDTPVRGGLGAASSCSEPSPFYKSETAPPPYSP